MATSGGTGGPVERFFSGRWAVPAVLLFMAVAVAAVYSNTLGAPFQFDDRAVILKDRMLTDLKYLPALLRGLRGVTMATFALNYAAGGFDAAGFRAVNIAVHIGSSFAAFFFLRETLRLCGLDEARSRFIAAVPALIFALHPVQTESVTYIVQRMESMSGLFYLLALFCFARALRAGDLKKAVFLYALVAFFYILAFKSKETAVTLPAVVLLYDLFFVAGGSFRPLIGRWPLYGALAALLVFFTINTVVPVGGFNDLSRESAAAASGVKPSKAGREAVKKALEEVPDIGEGILKKAPTAGFGVPDLTPWQYFVTESNVLLYYQTLLALPLNQNVDYDFPVSNSLFEVPRPGAGTVLNIPLPPPAISIILHIAALALSLFLFTRSLKTGAWQARVASFFILWFYIILSPTSSVIPIKDVIFEHRLYLPVLSFGVLLVLGLEAVLGRVHKKN